MSGSSYALVWLIAEFSVVCDQVRRSVSEIKMVLEKINALRVDIALPNRIESQIDGSFNQNAQYGSINDEYLYCVGPNNSFDSSLSLKWCTMIRII